MADFSKYAPTLKKREGGFSDHLADLVGNYVEVVTD